MGGPSVLIVEDEALICELIMDALDDEGVAAACAVNHDEALLRLAEHAETLKVLLTDVNLGPGKNGFVVAREARERLPEIFVLYVTGHAEVDLATEGVERAMLVPKPYLPGKLAGQIASLVKVAGAYSADGLK